jgi:cephalosporin hydroxylase
MRNAAKIFQESFGKIPKSTTEKIQKYTDMIDEVEQIIDEAYKLYMPQVRSEITDLTKFVIANSGLKDGKPIIVLEIGTKFGGSFYIWNKLNEIFTYDREHWSHFGWSDMRISVDLPNGIHGGVDLDSINKRNLYFLERFDNCHFIEGDSHVKETHNKVSELLNDQKVDFLFIDGDHTFDGIAQDFYDYLAFCKPQSFIAFHDIVISDHHHSRNVFVGEFWNEIKNDYNHWEFIESGNNWAGIGVIQLP